MADYREIIAKHDRMRLPAGLRGPMGRRQALRVWRESVAKEMIGRCDDKVEARRLWSTVTIAHSPSALTAFRELLVAGKLADREVLVAVPVDIPDDLFGGGKMDRPELDDKMLRTKWENK